MDRVGQMIRLLAFQVGARHRPPERRHRPDAGAAARDDVVATVADISRLFARYLQTGERRQYRLWLRLMHLGVFKKDGRVEQLVKPAKLQAARRQVAAFRSDDADQVAAPA